MLGQENAVHEAGFEAEGGSFICVGCSASISLDHPDSIPRCPSCGGEQFKRASLFEQPTHDHPVVEPGDEPEGWLDGIRATADAGKFAALFSGGRARVFGSPRAGHGSAAVAAPTSGSMTRRSRAATP